MDDAARLGMVDDPDGEPLRLFSPDDQGTPHLVAIDGSTAHTPEERRLLTTAANIAMATLWQWQQTGSNLAMNGHVATLTIALADDNARNEGQTTVWRHAAGAAGIIQLNRNWVGIGEQAGQSRQRAIMSWAERLADATVHELYHWPEQASRALTGTPELPDATTEQVMTHLLADLRRHVPAEKLAEFSSSARGWDRDKALRFADVMIDAVTSSNRELRTHGSFATLSRVSPQSRSAAADGVVAAVGAEIRAEFADTFPADATARNYEIWAVVGGITAQLPGYLPATAQFLDDEVGRRMQSVSPQHATVDEPVAYPPILHQDGFDGALSVRATYAVGPTGDAPRMPWAVPRGDQAFEVEQTDLSLAG